jgi:uncharacterized protein YegP (UPF0339 family)
MAKYEVLQAKAGRFYFQLKAKNGFVIATSQKYASLAACYNGIASVQANAQTEIIEDKTK